MRACNDGCPPIQGGRKVTESGMDYASAMMLLRNIGERKDTTMLEREAIATAVRLLKNNVEIRKS